jgi:GH24 family phage-related lysozyme (muramidase)
MKASLDAINLIKRSEGCSFTPYQDHIGLWTVGYGRLINDGKRLPDSYPKSFTQADVDAFLVEDVSRVDRQLNMLLTMPIKQCQYDALVSFTFNLGIGTFKSSSIYKALLKQDYVTAGKFILKYIYANHKVSKGLQTRRELEYNLYNKET